MSFNDKIEALRRRMDGGGAGHQQQRAAGNDRRIDNDPHSRIAQQLAASANNDDHARTAFQLAQLQSGCLALNARINSVTQFNEAVSKDSNSSAKILGLPSDCPPLTIKDSSGDHHHHIPTCLDCCSSSDDDYHSANSTSYEDVDGRDITQSERSKEKDLKDFAYSRTLAHFQDFKCPSTCSQGRNCMLNIGVVSAWKEIEYIWGALQDKTRTTKERKIVVHKKLLAAYHTSTGNKSLVSFVFSLVSQTDIKMCESSYLYLVAHPYSTMWKSAKKRVTQEMSINNHTTELSSADINKIISSLKPASEKKSRKKFDHAEKFIQWYAKTYGSQSPNTDEEDLHIVPFETIAQLFNEYQMSCKHDHLHPHDCASKETFRKVWVGLHKQKQVRFVRGKGTFPTCDICNNANDMLSNTKKYTQSQRDIILSYLQSHLNQQARERAACEGRKRFACNNYDEYGNPTNAFIFGDGMTKWAGHTPKYRQRLSKKETAFFENRVFGVEIHCGPISGEILIHTNDLVRGGANFVIEVQRRVLIELEALLKEKSLSMPKELHFQWDNCGENKNKEVFMFNALLVELGYFEKITVGFLIVGHTHASIDQYFSCLRKLIRRASFIASPLALQHLFSLDKSSSESSKSRMRSQYRPPLRQVQITFVRDYTAALAPYRSKHIKNYGIPYQFQFFMHLGKCICQYKQFFTSLEWLPLMPDLRSATTEDIAADNPFEQMFSKLVYDIEDNYSLSTTDGLVAFQQHIGLSQNGSGSELSHNFGNVLQIAGSLNDGLPILKRIEERALCEQELRHSDEAGGYNDHDRYLSDYSEGEDPEAPEKITVVLKHHQALCSNQHALESLNSRSKGFLIWIDYLSTQPTPPPIATVIPSPINPKIIWESSKPSGVVEALDLAEKAATAEAIQQLDNDDLIAENQGDRVLTSDSENSKCIREIEQSMAAKKKKRTKISLEAEKKKRTARSSIQHIVSALANMKAAANFVLQKRIATGQIEISNLSYKELSYHQLFQRKAVTMADYEFYQLHTSQDAILNAIDSDIQNSPPFEWLPLSCLSEKQLQERERSRLQQIQESSIIRKMCEHVLTREKEKKTGETVERLTNQAQEKQFERDLARQDKEARKLINKRRKADQKVEDKRSSSATDVKLQSSDDQKSQPLPKQSKSISSELKKINSRKSGAKRISMEKLKLLETVHQSDADFVDSDGVTLPQMSSLAQVTKSKRKANTLDKNSVSSADDEEDCDTVKAPVMDIPTVLAVQEGKFNDVSTSQTISYGKRLTRDMFNADDLRVAELLNLCLKRACTQWFRVAESKTSAGSNRGKRDGYTTLRLSCQQAVIEQLDFPQYRSSYFAVLDLHSIELDGYKSDMNVATIFSTSPSRVKFLERFVNVLLDKLCSTVVEPHNSLSQSTQLMQLIDSINKLPESY